MVLTAHRSGRYCRGHSGLDWPLGEGGATGGILDQTGHLWVRGGILDWTGCLWVREELQGMCWIGLASPGFGKAMGGVLDWESAEHASTGSW